MEEEFHLTQEEIDAYFMMDMDGDEGEEVALASPGQSIQTQPHQQQFRQVQEQQRVQPFYYNQPSIGPNCQHEPERNSKNEIQNTSPPATPTNDTPMDTSNDSTYPATSRESNPFNNPVLKGAFGWLKPECLMSLSVTDICRYKAYAHARYPIDSHKTIGFIESYVLLVNQADKPVHNELLENGRIGCKHFHVRDAQTGSDCTLPCRMYDLGHAIVPSFEHDPPGTHYRMIGMLRREGFMLVHSFQRQSQV